MIKLICVLPAIALANFGDPFLDNYKKTIFTNTDDAILAYLPLESRNGDWLPTDEKKWLSDFKSLNSIDPNSRPWLILRTIPEYLILASLKDYLTGKIKESTNFTRLPIKDHLPNILGNFYSDGFSELTDDFNDKNSRSVTWFHIKTGYVCLSEDQKAGFSDIFKTLNSQAVHPNGKLTASSAEVVYNCMPQVPRNLLDQKIKQYLPHIKLERLNQPQEAASFHQKFKNIWDSIQIADCMVKMLSKPIHARPQYRCFLPPIVSYQMGDAMDLRQQFLRNTATGSDPLVRLHNLIHRPKNEELLRENLKLRRKLRSMQEYLVRRTYTENYSRDPCDTLQTPVSAKLRGERLKLVPIGEERGDFDDADDSENSTIYVNQDIHEGRIGSLLQKAVSPPKMCKPHLRAARPSTSVARACKVTDGEIDCDIFAPSSPTTAGTPVESLGSRHTRIKSFEIIPENKANPSLDNPSASELYESHRLAESDHIISLQSLRPRINRQIFCEISLKKKLRRPTAVSELLVNKFIRNGCSTPSLL